ncbi:nuclear transport factor 2 family protein [Lysobacter enzymogenes]|uniref:nuclear transport factor 2 family protein n=1 Tax=Lysobacter enzymogenes TaxID=69 RepID=UPI0020291E6D|nr:nuclear transport factor 2 family protein [Lysobacter enzymogenes]
MLGIAGKAALAATLMCAAAASQPVWAETPAKPAGADGASAPAEAALPEGAALDELVAGLDAQLFDSFNRCTDPAQLERHGALFDEKIEFYHDLGGVTWTREAMVDSVRRNVCGKFRRELVAGSLRAYPIPGFGVMEIGEHRFCKPDGGACHGHGEFVMVWRRDGERWRVTRALSYAHRAVGEQE